MGAHPEAIARLVDRIHHATTPEQRDQLLEQLFDVTARVTEWDAMAWGFDIEGPRSWMMTERCEMDRRARGRGHWPTEAQWRKRTDAQMAAEIGTTGRHLHTVKGEASNVRRGS